MLVAFSFAMLLQSKAWHYFFLLCLWCSLGQDMMLPWRNPPGQKSLADIHRPSSGAQSFPNEEPMSTVPIFNLFFIEFCFILLAVYTLLEPETSTSSQEKSCGGGGFLSLRCNLFEKCLSLNGVKPLAVKSRTTFCQKQIIPVHIDFSCLNKSQIKCALSTSQRVIFLTAVTPNSEELNPKFFFLCSIIAVDKNFTVKTHLTILLLIHKAYFLNKEKAFQLHKLDMVVKSNCT